MSAPALPAHPVTVTELAPSVWKLSQRGRYWTIAFTPAGYDIRTEAGQQIYPHSVLGSKLCQKLDAHLRAARQAGPLAEPVTPWPHDSVIAIAEQIDPQHARLTIARALVAIGTADPEDPTGQTALLERLTALIGELRPQGAQPAHGDEEALEWWREVAATDPEALR